MYGKTNPVFVNNGTTQIQGRGDALVDTVTVKDQQGNPIGYNDPIAAGATVIYTATLKAKDGQSLTPEELEKCKRNIRWVFWVWDTQVETTDEGEKEALRMQRLFSSSSLKEETPKSFLNDQGNVTGDVLERCYLHYDLGSSEENKGFKDTLTISWSKWLDQVERVRVEAYIDDPKKISGNNDAAYSRVIQAHPEILEAYWMNALGERVRYGGYEQDVYLYVSTLGLGGKALEVEVHEQDFYQTPSFPIEFYGPGVMGDELIDWKNNSITIEKHDVLKQFKVGDKKRYDNAAKDEADEDYKKAMDEGIDQGMYTALMDVSQKYTPDLELYIHFPEQEHLKPDKDNQYARLTLTEKAQIHNAYFGTVAQASVQGDTPATKDSASPSTQVTYTISDLKTLKK